MNLFTLMAKIALDDSEYTSGVDSATRKGKSFANNLKTGIGGAVKAATAMIGVASTAVVGLGKLAFDYNSEIESYTSNFTVMLGDAEKAAQKVEELKKMGAETPFELSDLAKATTTLMAFNVSSDTSTGILQKLGDISLGNAQKLETLTRAYGKMNAAQKVSLEDINMMIDSGFNPLLLVAEETGESMTDLYKRISKGGVAFSEIQQAIDKATSAGGQYYKGMEVASKTTKGLISTLEDNARSLVGEVFEPITDGMTKTLLPGAITAIDQLTEAYRKDGVDGMIDAAGDIIGSGLAEISKKSPEVIHTGGGIIRSLLKGIRDHDGEITKGAGDTFFAFTDEVTRLLPDLFSTGTSIVENLAKYIEDNPDKVVDSAGSLFSAFLGGLADQLPELGTAAGRMVNSLATYLIENESEIDDAANSLGIRLVKGVVQGIKNFGSEIFDTLWYMMFGYQQFTPEGEMPSWSAGWENYQEYLGKGDKPEKSGGTTNIIINDVDTNNAEKVAKKVDRTINRNTRREVAIN